jgi:hypothetical protein
VIGSTLAVLLLVRAQLPAMKDNRLFSAFFIVFLVTGLFFMMSLVLAMVYSAYNAVFKSKISSKMRRVDGTRLLFAHPSD